MAAIMQLKTPVHGRAVGATSRQAAPSASLKAVRGGRAAAWGGNRACGIVARSRGKVLAMAVEEGAAAGEEEGGEESPLIRQAMIAYTKEIREHAKTGNSGAAIEELAKMTEMGITPDIVAVSAALDACVKARKPDLAQKVFAEMVGDDKVAPDEMVYSILMRGYGQADPPRWLAMSALMQSMERDHAIRPTAMTYNPMLEACARTNDLERAQELMDRMEDTEVEPNKQSILAVSKRKSLRSYLRKIM